MAEPKKKGWLRAQRRAEKQQAFTMSPTAVVKAEQDNRRDLLSKLRDRAEPGSVAAVIGGPRALTKEQLGAFSWRTQDGRIMALTELRDAHLRNAVEMLTKQRAAAQEMAVRAQRIDADQSRAYAYKAARCAQWLFVMDCEQRRRAPLGLADKPLIKPTGSELYAMPEFYTAEVTHV